MKLLLISGSLRRDSYNTAIIKFIANYFIESNSVQPIIYNELALIPPFNPDLDIHDLEKNMSQQKVQKLRKNIKNSDAVLIATPEYAYEIPGVLKNALDWMVSSGEFVKKPTMVISSSTSFAGGESAHAVLRKLLNVLSAKVIEDKPINIGFINQKIDENGMITDDVTAKILIQSVNFLYKSFGSTGELQDEI
jgi:NAD(P)H-dependent FMN reductase